MPVPLQPDPADRHRQRMRRKKAVVDARIQRATEERGVLLVNTGNGKGKSSAAFGLAARALGHGLKVGIVQFIKGKIATGEEAFFRRFPEVSYTVMGEGFTWETQDKAKDQAAATAAWEQARTLLNDPAFHLVILDELNITLKHRYIDVAEVLEAVTQRPRHQHVVITGRAAPAELIAAADTVTDMREVKHAFKAGVKAQKGMEL
ncbi:MAG TPA: cob(I)yrinic acid a,c-diamide adenosyltransferase [Gammaproteobacteria bacterium]|nr:cob(I)yrinic acid a,c-diamide adenosyltransferase [Gammaproteobacteria bacterium]